MSLLVGVEHYEREHRHEQAQCRPVKELRRDMGIAHLKQDEHRQCYGRVRADKAVYAV